MARQRIDKLLGYLRPLLQKSSPTAAKLGPVPVVYMQGQKHTQRRGTDVDLPFRQESNFYYVTGGSAAVESQSDAHLLIRIDDGQAILFVPRITADEQVWVGAAPSLEQLRASTGLECRYVNELPLVLAGWSASSLITLPGTEDIETATLTSVPVDQSPSLQDALIECRLRKEESELDRMRQANRKSSEAHRSLMQFVANNHRQTGFSEQTVTAEWYSETMQRGLMYQAYLPICAYGPNAAVLHYTNNNAPIPSNYDSFLLVDAGGEYRCYAADITRTYPVNGKFDTAEKRTLYSIVLNAQKRVVSELRPGASWEHLHRLATEVIGQGLLAAGVLRLPDSETTLNSLCWEHFVVQLFFPHGLGHLIGLDVHDCGGYPRGVGRIQQPGIRYLRMRRDLEPGFVVTVEPGCYFIEQLLGPALEDPNISRFIDVNVLNRYRPLGGVRIEDVVAITRDGHENFVSAPKEIADIEALMQSSLG